MYIYIYFVIFCVLLPIDFNIQLVILKFISGINILRIFCEIVLKWIPKDLWWLDNIGSDSGLVPSGNKELSEPMLIQIDIASPGHDE